MSIYNMASNDQRVKEQLNAVKNYDQVATNMLLPIDDPQRNLMQQRPPPLLPCQQQPQLLKPQDQYLISTNRQSCYLCETPRASYALISSVYSEVVCRSCVNYEGPDRVEFTIRQARRLKIQSSQLQIHPTCINTAAPVSAFMSKFSPIISQPPPIQHPLAGQQLTNHQHQQRLHHQQYLQTQPLHYQNQPQHNINEDPHVILQSKGRSTIPCSNNKNSIFNINQHPISPQTPLNVPPTQVIVAPKLAPAPEAISKKQSLSSNNPHQSKNLSEQALSSNRPKANCSIIDKDLNSGHEKSDSQQSFINKQRHLHKGYDSSQIKAQKSKPSNDNKSTKLLQAQRYHEQQKRHLDQDITTNGTMSNKVMDDNSNEDDDLPNQLSTANHESLASRSNFETNELSAKKSNPQSPMGSQSSETTNSTSIDELSQNHSILSKSSGTNVNSSNSTSDGKQTNLSQSVLLQRIKAYDSAIAQALSMRQVFYQQHLNRSVQEEAAAIPSRNAEYQSRNLTLVDKRYVDEHSLSKRFQNEHKIRDSSKNQANPTCKSNELDNSTQSAYMSASALASIDKKTLSTHKSTCPLPGLSNNLSTTSDILLKQHDSRNDLEDLSITNDASKLETSTKAAYITQFQASRFTTSGNQQGSHNTAVSKQKLLMTATINTFSSNKATDKTMSESSTNLDEHESNNLWQANNNRPYKRLKQNKLNSVGDECSKLASRNVKLNEEKSIQSKQPDKQLSAKVLGEINGIDLKNCDGDKKNSKSASEILNPATLSKSPQIHITVASTKTLSEVLSTTATSMATTTTVTDASTASMRTALHANSSIVSKSICNTSTPTQSSYRGSATNTKSFLISNNLLDNNNSNNRCKMLKSEELKCCQCHEIMENKHFVQCPSVAKHKFCFGCSKKSIEEQRAEYIRQHQQREIVSNQQNSQANLTNTSTKSSSSSNNPTGTHSNNDYEKLFCPSGKKCFLANERSPWAFMNNEIETIFRESNRYSNGEKCSMMKSTDNDSYMPDEFCVSGKTGKRGENIVERAIEINQISTDTSDSKLTI